MFDDSTLQLPTDTLTLGDLRRVESQYFQLQRDRVSHDVPADGISAIFMQLRLAEKAYARERRQVDPHPDQYRESTLKQLDHFYQRYGISHNSDESAQLIRNVERQAEVQAREKQQRTR